MSCDFSSDTLEARLGAAVRENKRLRAETARVIEESRAWSDAVARNIREAPRLFWQTDPPDGIGTVT